MDFQALHTLEWGIVIAVGLVLGSFATAVTYRETNGISWAFTPDNSARSACTSCKTNLGVIDLVPLFSWLVLRGKCRHCGNPISVLYPVTELTSLLMCALVYLSHGFTPQAFVMMTAVPFLIALVLVDLRLMILPNLLVFIVGVLGGLSLIARIFAADLAPAQAIPYILSAFGYSLFAFVLGWVVSRILKKEALGMGDVKFFAAAGIWLGPLNLPLFCLLSGIIGVAFGSLWMRLTKTTLFPFGPALVITLAILMVTDASFWSFFIVQ